MFSVHLIFPAILGVCADTPILPVKKVRQKKKKKGEGICLCDHCVVTVRPLMEPELGLFAPPCVRDTYSASHTFDQTNRPNYVLFSVPRISSSPSLGWGAGVVCSVGLEGPPPRPHLQSSCLTLISVHASSQGCGTPFRRSTQLHCFCFYAPTLGLW